MFTRDFVMSLRALPECTARPPELDYEFTFEKRENPKPPAPPGGRWPGARHGHPGHGNGHSGHGPRKPSAEFKKKITSLQQTIRKIPIDAKRINNILNKLTESNYDKLLEETRSFDYKTPEIVTRIFRKVVSEPFFAKLYSRLCKDLEEIHGILESMYVAEFASNKSKNLGIFIAELFCVGLVRDISVFTNELESNLDEKNLEILCALITRVGITNHLFKKDIKLLRSVQNNFTPRFRFMILDIIEKV